MFSNSNRRLPKSSVLLNVVLAPHADTGTVEARTGLAAEAVDNLISFFDGNPINVVNK
ncbi:lactate dehydrogenase-like 2-hydroxyacid dehydrogenase [Bifidobacterium commune]|uniref:hypothetical protein n=1 Tax=Bifidobacterium commune TaxID=1505727 RepID=UPI0017FCFAAC|nr:hypothetical protein [Bifidobacterium commune]MBB2954656.1 lactate dehydrogenase-like 2-hydroxyacid dehydrogenase [Bifidobacterium commune]